MFWMIDESRSAERYAAPVDRDTDDDFPVDDSGPEEPEPIINEYELEER